MRQGHILASLAGWQNLGPVYSSAPTLYPRDSPETSTSSSSQRARTGVNGRLMQVPPTEVVKTADFLEGLAAEPDEPCNWELGGQTNVLISAARLGLRAAAVCSLGDDAHGAFLRKELQVIQRLLPKCCASTGVPEGPRPMQFTPTAHKQRFRIL